MPRATEAVDALRAQLDRAEAGKERPIATPIRSGPAPMPL